MIRRRRMLLLSPSFHGYWRCVADAFGALGYEVTSHPYDQLQGTAAKLEHKVRHELPDLRGGDRGHERFSRAVTEEALRLLRQGRPDVVLTIKGDLLLPSFWSEVRRLGGVGVLWMYDELRRMHHRLEDLRRPDLLVSYSPRDVEFLTAQGLEVLHLNDAFDARARYQARPSGDVVFIGARYPEREKALLALDAAGIPVLAVGRDWSHHPVDRARTWSWRRPDLPAVRDITREGGYGLMAGSLAALNSHTDQDGFTMRTFEAPGCGGLQLIDRPDVGHLYEPGREVLVYTSPDELVEHSRRAQREPAWARSIRAAGRRRTLAEHTFDHRARVLESLWA